MTDTLSPAQRSARMARVRSRGNRSTEIRVMHALRSHGLKGWRRHPKSVPGTPDFYFSRPAPLALFVDGCFWHACPKCGRLPKSRRAFWVAKIDENRRRDERMRRLLRRAGIATMRVWEHELNAEGWIDRLKRRLAALAMPTAAEPLASHGVASWAPVGRYLE